MQLFEPTHGLISLAFGGLHLRWAFHYRLDDRGRGRRWRLASALTTQMDAIAATILGLGPTDRPTYYPSPYVRAHADPGGGSASHRQFWFGVSAGGQITEQGRSALRLEHIVPLYLGLNLSPFSASQRPAIVYQEAIAMLNAVHATAAVPNSHAPRALSYQPQALDGNPEDVRLLIPIRIRTREQGATP